MVLTNPPFGKDASFTIIGEDGDGESDEARADCADDGQGDDDHCECRPGQPATTGTTLTFRDELMPRTAASSARSGEEWSPPGLVAAGGVAPDLDMAAACVPGCGAVAWFPAHLGVMD